MSKKKQESQTRQWLKAYREGNIEALEYLVEHFRHPLYAFILKMTEAKSDPDDIFQEVWFRAIKKLDTFNNKNLMSWLFRIAHNLIIDQARKQRPLVNIHTSDDNNENPIEATIPSQTPGPEHQLKEAELKHRIQTATDQLPPEQKAVFVMRMYMDMSFKQIAETQQISINTALARMQYALAKLREELKDDFKQIQRGVP